MTSMLFTARTFSVAGIGAAAAMNFTRRDWNAKEGAALLARPPRVMFRLAPGLRRLVASLGALRPAGVLLGVILRRRLDQRTHLVLDRVEPVRGLHPLGSVPLRDECLVMAVVVVAGDLHRRAEAFKTELLETRFCDVQRLQA